MGSEVEKRRVGEDRGSVIGLLLLGDSERTGDAPRGVCDFTCDWML